MAPVCSRMRSASVDLPWSMWAMMEKLRMWSCINLGADGQMERERPAVADKPLGEALRGGLRVHAQDGLGAGEPEEEPAVVVEDDLDAVRFVDPPDRMALD